MTTTDIADRIIVATHLDALPLLTPAERAERLRIIAERLRVIDERHPPITDLDPDFEAGIAVAVAETTGESQENANGRKGPMTARKPDLTLAQRLAVYDRQRELEARAPSDGVTGEMLQLQTDPNYDPAVSQLPHARPAPPRPAVVAETARRLAKACETAELETRTRRAQLAAIAAGILPHSVNWKHRTAVDLTAPRDR
jgi:hypothetical protein